jgi:hypothetical protein
MLFLPWGEVNGYDEEQSILLGQILGQFQCPFHDLAVNGVQSVINSANRINSPAWI